jgi:hypothetical protein
MATEKEITGLMYIRIPMVDEEILFNANMLKNKGINVNITDNIEILIQNAGTTGISF